MSLQNTFHEIQDPKVLARLRNTFVALALTGLLVAFVGSEDFRDVVVPFESGVDDNHPVQVDRKYQDRGDPTKVIAQAPGSKGGKTQRFEQPQETSQGVSNPIQPQEPTDGPAGNGGHPGSDNTGGGNPGSAPANPGTPVSGAPTTPGQPGTVPGGPTTPSTPTPSTPAQPKGPLSPIVTPVLETVNETVNGVTEKVNDTTNRLPVQTNLPEDVCLLKC